MFEFFEWYLPWPYIDVPLKVMAVIWLLSTTLGLCIFIRSVVFKKPWLTMRHMQQPSEKTDQ